MAKRTTGVTEPSRDEWADQDGVPPRTLASELVQSLRSAIIYGEILPGARLNILALSAQYSVSPGVIREALSRLVPEGLVQNLDQRGFRAAPVSTEAIMDITRVRVVLESEALRQAIAKGDTEWEGDVLAALHRLSKTPYFEDETSGEEKDEWTVRHKIFHRTLISACGSDWLMRFHDLLMYQSERYRALNRQYQSRQSVDERRDVREQHRLIVEAALARDADRAVALIEEHFMGTARRVIRAQEINDAAAAAAAAGIAAASDPAENAPATPISDKAK